jgi:hypothetical protein
MIHGDGDDDNNNDVPTTVTYCTDQLRTVGQSHCRYFTRTVSGCQRPFWPRPKRGVAFPSIPSSGSRACLPLCTNWHTPLGCCDIPKRPSPPLHCCRFHRHSAIPKDDEYGDSTGYMGRSMPVAWVTRTCYNASQHWALGWHEMHLRLLLAEPAISITTTTTSNPPVLTTWQR